MVCCSLAFATGATVFLSCGFAMSFLMRRRATRSDDDECFIGLAPRAVGHLFAASGLFLFGAGGSTCEATMASSSSSSSSSFFFGVCCVPTPLCCPPPPPIRFDSIHIQKTHRERDMDGALALGRRRFCPRAYCLRLFVKAHFFCFVCAAVAAGPHQLFFDGAEAGQK